MKCAAGGLFHIQSVIRKSVVFRSRKRDFDCYVNEVRRDANGGIFRAVLQMIEISDSAAFEGRKLLPKLSSLIQHDEKFQETWSYSWNFPFVKS